MAHRTLCSVTSNLLIDNGQLIIYNCPLSIVKGGVSTIELSPRLYHWLVRPDWYNRNYTKNILTQEFHFNNKKVLDFGCGIGANCFLFKPENYLGVDPDQKRIKYAKEVNPGYQFDIAGRCINVSNNSFDIILIIAVLHHIPTNKLSDIIKEFNRILKSEGKIIVLEPCLFKEYFFNNYYMKLFDRGKYIRDQKEYLDIFKNQNFRIDFVEKLSKITYKEILFSASPGLINQ